MRPACERVHAARTGVAGGPRLRPCVRGPHLPGAACRAEGSAVPSHTTPGGSSLGGGGGGEQDPKALGSEGEEPGARPKCKVPVWWQPLPTAPQREKPELWAEAMVPLSNEKATLTRESRASFSTSVPECRDGGGDQDAGKDAAGVRKKQGGLLANPQVPCPMPAPRAWASLQPQGCRAPTVTPPTVPAPPPQTRRGSHRHPAALPSSGDPTLQLWARGIHPTLATQAGRAGIPSRPHGGARRRPLLREAIATGPEGSMCF